MCRATWLAWSDLLLELLLQLQCLHLGEQHLPLLFLGGTQQQCRAPQALLQPTLSQCWGGRNRGRGLELGLGPGAGQSCPGVLEAPTPLSSTRLHCTAMLLQASGCQQVAQYPTARASTGCSCFELLNTAWGLGHSLCSLGAEPPLASAQQPGLCKCRW